MPRLLNAALANIGPPGILQTRSPGRSAPEKFRYDAFDDFPTISLFFPREILNDLLARYK